MADDLGDEWWLDPKGAHVEEFQEETKDPTRVKPKHKENLATVTREEQQGKKRKKSTPNSQQENDQEGNQTKRKKKKKKKTLTEHLATAADRPGSSDDLRVSMATYFHNKLSAIEMEELILEECCFLGSRRGGESVSEYLSRTVPDWSETVKKEQETKTPNKSCILLVLTSSAKRAVDLNRDAAAFREKCVTAKLFAKHLKISEQEKFLASHRVQFAVATPHRVSCLLESGAMTLNDTRHVILDWNWRDAKLRRVVDIPEIKKDLFGLLRKHLVPAANRGYVKFGLF